MAFFVHPHGICESSTIGDGTRVWAFAHVLGAAVIGAECNICDHVFVENDVIVGDRVTIKCGVQLWDGIRLGNDVFVGPNVSFTNDMYPRSKAYPGEFLRTVVADGASIGAGAVVTPGVTIGPGAMVGAGAVVTRDVPAFAQVRGNPARVSGFLGSDGQLLEAMPARQLAALDHGSMVPLDLHRDPRGSLAAIEFDDRLPFVPRRFFSVSSANRYDVRGLHAHRACEQILVALHGELSCLMDDGSTRRVVRLSDPGLGLYLPTKVWGGQFDATEGAVLGVLASMHYDKDDYIADYEEFRKAL